MMQTRSLPRRMLAAVAVGVAASGFGQVLNSDFATRLPEEYHWPAAWSAAKTDRGAVYRLVDDDGHSGKDCLRYQCQTTGPAGAVTQAVSSPRNTTCLLDAWLKSDGTLRPVVTVTTDDAARRELARLTADQDPKWHRKAATFDSGTAARVCVALYGDERIVATGQAVVGHSAIDDVRIEFPVAAAAAPAQAGAGGALPWTAPGPNVGLNRPYTLNRPPTYGLCSDPSDRVQLTDGVYTVGYFWAQKSSVGWSGGENAPVLITVDLGQVESICGVSYNTAGGVAGVHWPRLLLVMTSDDGQAWFLAGDLVQLAAATQRPPAAQGYALHRYATGSLKTQGRFVGLLVDSDNYIFCDEIEVYGGTAPTATSPQGRPIGAPLDYFWRGQRVESDLATIAERLASARVATPDLDKARSELAALRSVAGVGFPALPPDTPAILPLNETQARIFALNGIALRALGRPSLFAWKTNRYDPLDPIEQPAAFPARPPALAIRMMSGEWRSDAVVLTNASPEPAEVRLRVEGLPGGANPPWLSLRDVPFVDSVPRVDVACPLPEATRDGADYLVTVPAGMNRQIWLLARPLDLGPGSSEGTLVVQRRNPAPLELRIPVRLIISRIRFPPRPRLHLGGWDYTHAPTCYDVLPSNRELLVAYMKEHYVDAPWSNSGALPGVTAEDFGAEGALTRPLDFAVFDDWVRRWSGARVFLCFFNAPAEFVGCKLGTPPFNQRVAAWISAIAAHLRDLGLQPDQLGLLILDEPNSEAHAAHTKAWADAIHQAGTGVGVWVDPQYGEPQSPVINQSLQACDTVCPFVPLFIRLDEAKRDAYRALRTERRQLWFYNASGPVRVLDPYSYHRLQHWLCFSEGAEGSCFWAFGDAGGGSSWNERAAKRAGGYAPQYLARDSVTDSKHMLAIMEGIQDYEYLCLLRDRVQALEAKGIKSAVLDQARDLLHDGPRQAVAGLYEKPDTEMLWRAPKDRSLADRIAERVLDMLEALADAGGPAVGVP